MKGMLKKAAGKEYKVKDSTPIHHRSELSLFCVSKHAKGRQTKKTKRRKK